MLMTLTDAACAQQDPFSPSTNTVPSSGLAFSPAQHWLCQPLATEDTGSAKGSRGTLKKPVPNFIRGLNLLPKTPCRVSLLGCYRQPASCSENKRTQSQLQLNDMKQVWEKKGCTEMKGKKMEFMLGFILGKKKFPLPKICSPHTELAITISYTVETCAFTVLWVWFLFSKYHWIPMISQPGCLKHPV